MKNILVWVFCIGLLSFASCNNQSEKAADYSDEIIIHQIEIIDAIDSLKTSFRKYNKDDMSYAYVDLQKSVSDGMRKVNGLKPFAKDSIYLNEAKVLFKTYESLSENEFPMIIELLNIPDTSFTTNNQTTVFKLQGQINDQLNEAHERFMAAQEDFGKKFKVEFEDPEE